MCPEEMGRGAGRGRCPGDLPGTDLRRPARALRPDPLPAASGRRQPVPDRRPSALVTGSSLSCTCSVAPSAASRCTPPRGSSQATSSTTTGCSTTSTEAIRKTTSPPSPGCATYPSPSSTPGTGPPSTEPGYARSPTPALPPVPETADHSPRLGTEGPLPGRAWHRQPVVVLLDSGAGESSSAPVPKDVRVRHWSTSLFRPGVSTPCAGNAASSEVATRPEVSDFAAKGGRGGEGAHGGADVERGSRIGASHGGGSCCLAQHSRDQRAAQRERQRALREYEGKQSDRLVGRHGQGRPADEQQRPADCHA